MTWVPASEEWAEKVRSRLLDQRTVMITGVLDDQQAGRLAAELMTLDATGDERVHLRIDSSDGTLDAALTVMDVVDLLGVPVTATCLGRLEGPAVGVLAVAQQRSAAPHARIRLCEPREQFAGRASEVAVAAEHHQRRLETFCDRLAAATGRPAERVEADLRAGIYLDAQEALRYGLVDEIARARVAEVRRLPGFQPGT